MKGERHRLIPLSLKFQEKLHSDLAEIFLNDPCSRPKITDQLLCLAYNSMGAGQFCLFVPPSLSESNSCQVVRRMASIFGRLIGHDVLLIISCHFDSTIFAEIVRFMFSCIFNIVILCGCNSSGRWSESFHIWQNDWS